MTLRHVVVEQNLKNVQVGLMKMLKRNRLRRLNPGFALIAVSAVLSIEHSLGKKPDFFTPASRSADEIHGESN